MIQEVDYKKLFSPEYYKFLDKTSVDSLSVTSFWLSL